MTGRLVAVSGTGTSIGKTHFAEALLGALRRTLPRVVGIKPVETGVETGVLDAPLSDGERLRRASSFHVQQSGYVFTQAVSPHLASRETGRPIDIGVIRSIVEQVRAETDLTLVELAGGLFSPLSESTLNIDLMRQLEPDFSVLVAPDRLGVLHDVLAATRAAESLGTALSAVVAMAPETSDGSTGRNILELLLFIRNVTVLELPRGAPSELSENPALIAMARAIAGREREP
jgi:dethiobiotin synthetase